MKPYALRALLGVFPLDLSLYFIGASPVAQTESACNAQDLGSIPGSGRSPGERNSYPLQYSCLENPVHELRSLVGYRPWGHKPSDTTEQVTTLFYYLFKLNPSFFGGAVPCDLQDLP